MSDPDPDEPGLAAERTDLAWTRSGLAVAVCAAILLRHLWPLHAADQFVAVACVSCGSIAWALVLVMGRARSGSTDAEWRRLSRRKAAVITFATIALAAAGLVLTFFPTT
jgi:uncharacterized membrane protein YidH (DUF202 family)